MNLAADEVHVWIVDLSSLTNIEDLKSLLNPVELAKAKRFRFDIHRQRYIAAHGVLRNILSKYLQTAPENIAIEIAENKKPYIANSPIQFNLSHSENMALIAIGFKDQVGIDIELIQENFMPEIATRYFSVEENELIAELEDSKQATLFYEIWTRKEALIKATGDGFSLKTNEFSSMGDKIELDGTQWKLTPLTIENYAATLVTTPKIKNVSILTWH